MNPLYVKCFVDKNVDRSDRELREFVDEMERLYPLKLDIEEFDASELEYRAARGRLYVNDESIFKHTLPVFKKQSRQIDAVKFFISNRNWKNGEVRLRGYKLGRIFNSYYVTVTRMRKGWKDTAEHELLHLVDEYTLANYGVRLEDVMKVKDFDSDVVHSQKYWKDENYKYDEAWVKIAPYISNAVEKRRNSYYLAVLNSIKVILMDMLKQYESHSIPDIEIKKMHVKKKYSRVNPMAVIGHIDLGREAGTIQTIVDSAKTASYNWYIPRQGNYVIEFVPLGNAAWHAGRISNPTAKATELLGGLDNLIQSGEPNNLSYGICYEGLTVNTSPTKKQIDLAIELVKYLKIDKLEWIEHWQVTDFKPRIVSEFVNKVNSLLKLN